MNTKLKRIKNVNTRAYIGCDFGDDPNEFESIILDGYFTLRELKEILKIWEGQNGAV